MMHLLLFIGTTEIILIAAVALLIFGGKKIPELMRGLGQGVQSFKKGMKEPIDTPEEKKKTEEKETSEEEAK